jgi:hypothetical protein
MSEAQAYEYTANRIRQLKFQLVSGMIDGRAYVHGRATFLDLYLRATTDHEIDDEKQRICEVR